MEPTGKMTFSSPYAMKPYSNQSRGDGGIDIGFYSQLSQDHLTTLNGYQTLMLPLGQDQYLGTDNSTLQQNFASPISPNGVQNTHLVNCCYGAPSYIAPNVVCDRYGLQQTPYATRTIIYSEDNGIIGAAVRSGSMFPPSCKCGNNCVGTFLGAHKCLRKRKKPVVITCLGSYTCRSTFKTRNEFNRHYASIHLETVKKFDCPITGCPRVGKNGFKRSDNLVQHRRGVHGEDIPKSRVRFSGSGGITIPMTEGLETQMDGFSFVRARLDSASAEFSLD